MNAYMSSTILKQKAIGGITWSLIEKFGIQGLKLILGIILARLLTPADFGLIGMVSVFFIVAQVFVESGFGQAYIQKKDVTEIDANTIFYTNLAISLFIYGMLWMGAPAIAGFYEQQALVDLIRVMGLIIIINAFNVIQIARICREIDFKRKTKIALTAGLVSGAAGIGAACNGLGVWSLVIHQMATIFLTTAGHWITSKWKPALSFSFESFRTLFSFGAWVLASSIIRTVFDNIYLLIIGKLFPVAQLGFYTKAKQFQQLSSVQFAGAVAAVAFPVLSKIQEDKKRLKSSLSKFLTHSQAIILPLMITLIVIAEPFVFVVLTEKWSPMIPYMQLLCIIGILYPIHLVNVQFLQAQGKSNLNFRLALIKNTFRIVNIVVMYRWGIAYIILGEILVSVLSLIINTFYTKRLICYGIMDQLRDIKQIIISSVLSGLIGYAITLSFENMYVALTVRIFVCLTLYILFQYLLNRSFFFEIWSLKENFIK